jgi:hypothetical protein
MGCDLMGWDPAVMQMYGDVFERRPLLGGCSWMFIFTDYVGAQTSVGTNLRWVDVVSS